MQQLILDFQPVERCAYCGNAYVLDVFEVYIAERTFQIETCCEGAHEDATMDLSMMDERELGKWFEAETGIGCRRIVADRDAGASYGNGGLCLDFGLKLRAVDWATAKAFIAEHHRHNRPPAGWRWGHAVYNGAELVAVCVVGHPQARMLQQRHPEMAEVTRVCVRPDLPKWATWNACSMLYAAAAKEARRRGFERIITYTREDEKGGTLVASGWTTTHRSKLDRRGWDRSARRRRASKGSPCRKLRWERGLTKRARRTVRQLADRHAERCV